MRTCLCELNRIHSHLIWLGTAALELGAISMFWYCFREREQILDLFEMVCGTRMHTRYFQAGGLAEDIPRGFFPEARQVRRAGCRRRSTSTRRSSTRTRSGSSGRSGSGSSRPTTRSRSASRARCCAPRASTGTCAGSSRTSPTPSATSDVPVYHEGDVYARYRVHMDEMRESTKIIDQCLDRLEGMEGEPWIADDRKVVLPPREELHTSMESLIHHFKIVTEGYRVPEGEVYVTVESPRGELGCYVVSDGGPKPWRVKFRAPSFVALAGDRDLHDRRARRRHDRDRRLARHGHGRGRPVSAATLFDRIQAVRERFPEGSRSATIPALRLAQEQYGWLPPEAIREVADALDLTPAYCHAVASFYDMFHLEPVGEHLVEVCTNLSCALVGRPARRRGVRGGARRARRARRRDDGKVTFRTVECLGGCGYATVVAVDSRYHQHVKPEDVPAIVRGIDGRA